MGKRISAKTLEGQRRLLEALRTAANTTTSVADLATASGFLPRTLSTYLRKNMLAPHVVLAKKGQCRIGALTDLQLGDVRRALSQRSNRYTYEHLGVSELVSSLLERSRTNAGLALEIINRPELANRLDAFVLLFVTAWEQLLKAELANGTSVSIFDGGSTTSGRQTTISFGKALAEAIPDRADPVRRNLEQLKDLRDSAAHLLVAELSGIATRYFQSGILNYIGRFQAIAEEAPFRFEGTGLLTLGVAYSSPGLEVLRARFGPNAAEVQALIAHLETAAEAANDERFAIPIRYQLVLDKRPGENAIRLINDPSGTPVTAVHVPKDPMIACPHTTTACAALLSTRTGRAWSVSDVAAVAAFLGVKKDNNEYHYEYRAGSVTHRSYSDRFVEKVVERLAQNTGLVADAVAAAQSKRRPSPRRVR